MWRKVLVANKYFHTNELDSQKRGPKHVIIYFIELWWKKKYLSYKVNYTSPFLQMQWQGAFQQNIDSILITHNLSFPDFLLLSVGWRGKATFSFLSTITSIGSIMKSQQEAFLHPLPNDQVCWFQDLFIYMNSF